MSLLREKLKNDKFAAIRSGDKEKAALAGFIYAEVTTIEKNEKRELSDEEIVKMIFSAISTSKDNLANAVKINDVKNISFYTREKEMLETYLPAQLSEEEVKAIIINLITENGFSSMKDMGKLKSLVEVKVDGLFDAKEASKLASKILQKNQ